MPDFRVHSDTSNVIRFILKSSADGQGLTGLTSASSGLIISTIADNEATATAYTVAGSTIEGITTLGTFATPTATKCRFKEVDATNHPGLYEFQFANARFAIASAKRMVISVKGAANLSNTDYEVEFTNGFMPRLQRAVDGITFFTVGSGSTVTSVVTSALDPSPTVTDQFKGLILAFDRATTTAALRGQKTDITGSTTGGVLTVTSLTTFPSSGDFGVIE